MPSFDITTPKGEKFTVTADSDAQAQAAINDILGGAAPAPKPEKSFTDKLAETTIGKLVMGAVDAAKLPGDVYSGKQEINDPADAAPSDDTIQRSLGLGGFAVGAPPGSRFIPRTMGTSEAAAETAAPRAADAAPPAAAPATGPAPAPAARPTLTPVEQAGVAEGVPVPRFLGTDNKAVQMVMQAAKQSPVGGPRIEKAAQDFLSGVEGAVERTATKTAGRAEGLAAPTIDEVGTGVRNSLSGVMDANENAVRAAQSGFEGLAPAAAAGERGALGADAIAGVEGRIAANRQAQDAGYQDLRRLFIDADRELPVSNSVSRTLNDVMRARTSAGEAALPRDLAPIAELATSPRGATFNGLQRARNTLGQRIDFEAGQGFDVGDLKRAYGAITDAMRSHVQGAARHGASQAALGAFTRAEQNFGRLAETNGRLRGFAQSGPEALVDRMVQYASDKAGGNIENLRFLRDQLPADVNQRVSRHAFDRLSRDAQGNFSTEALVKNWQNMSPAGRGALFGADAMRMNSAIRNLTDVSSRMGATNASLAKLLTGTDTEVVNRLIGMATSGSKSDIQSLRRLSASFGREHVDGMASVVLQRLGKNQKGEFSGAFFEKNWNKLSEEGKAFLFSNPAVRKSIDNILTLTKAETSAAKYANHSQTGRVGISAMIGGAAFAHPIGTIFGVLGGEMAARVMAKPRTAQAALDWTRVMVKAQRMDSKARELASKEASERFARIISTEFALPKAANDVGASLAGASRGAAENGGDN